MASDFTKPILRISKAVEAIVADAFLKVLAEKARTILYRRVKSGKGVDLSTLEEESLKPLSSKYISFRQGGFSFEKKSKGKKKTVNKGKLALGAYGSPGKSNLTLTGQMLESIEIKIQKYGFLLYFPTTPHKYSKRITVRELAQYVQEQGRPFFQLSRGERRVLLQAVQDEVRRQLRRK